ncbi:MAG: hypothetical protein IT204_07280 [Fimbriimonadaceae bacterium]|nr:hypothetical protein [Fimbriimonadaceae bacterium]
MKRLLLLLALVLTTVAADPPRREPLTLLVVGQTMDYLEPCGCGGQVAGGLARRAALLDELRREFPGAPVIDLGGQGFLTERLPLILRAAAYSGVALAGCAADDLAAWEHLAPAAAAAGMPLTSLPPPRLAAPPAPPRSLVIGPQRGWRIGVVAVSLPEGGVTALAPRLAAELTQLRQQRHCDLTVLLSHLGYGDTERLLERLPAAQRPRLVLLASAYGDTLPYFEELGATWVPVAAKGRSVSRITFASTPRGVSLSCEQRMVLAGVSDAAVASWVDAFVAAQRAGQVQQVAAGSTGQPAVSTCGPCHAAAVTAWRAHPHGHAVETLEQAGRDVAACLVCHAEQTRRLGLRPPATGDRGVECATCHEGLAAHLADPQTRPTTGGREACERCHTSENSPRWDLPKYLANVRGACAGTVQPRLAAPGG